MNNKDIKIEELDEKKFIFKETRFIKANRETGFEILRIISIFLISCVHLMNYGGMLSNAGGGITI